MEPEHIPAQKLAGPRIGEMQEEDAVRPLSSSMRTGLEIRPPTASLQFSAEPEPEKEPGPSSRGAMGVEARAEQLSGEGLRPLSSSLRSRGTDGSSEARPKSTPQFVGVPDDERDGPSEAPFPP